MREKRSRRISPHTAFVCEHFFGMQKSGRGRKKLLCYHTPTLCCVRADESFSGGEKFHANKSRIFI
jgi:hypothetical protein